MGDIAIIKLATPIEKSDDIDYAPLPASDAVPDGSEELFGIGWGLNVTWEGDEPDFLVPKRAEVLLEQQPFDKCLDPQRAGDVSTLICAGKPGKTVCSGDSGGPLIDSKTGTVVGIVSISVADLDGFLCTDAALFTRVGSYLDFINENLGQRGFTMATTRGSRTRQKGRLSSALAR
ncbi:Chymotrypsin-like elastase family member 2A [Beauveria bassiana]|nr:Chymotrypsin-like elastase family member 2A [Beauveria bassiana]